MKTNWQTKKLDDLCEKITDGTHITPKYKPTGVPFLSVKNLTDGFIDFSNTRFISLEEHNQLTKKYKPEKEDILYTKVGTTGIARIVDTDQEFSIFVSIALLKIKHNIIYNRYLEHFLNSPIAREQAKKRTRGTANKNLVITDIKEIIISFPEFIPAQHRIVKILDEAFSSIAKAKENAEKNLQNARELFQSVLSQAVIGELTKEWREEQGEEKTKSDTDLKEIHLRIRGREKKTSRSEETTGHGTITKALPKEWQFTSIESLFNLIDYRGKNPPRTKNGRRLITAKNIKMGYLSDEPITFVSEETYRKWMVRGFPKPDDIFFVTEGHTMGFVALNTRNDDFALAQRTITLQPIVSFSTKYFFYFMMSFYFQSLVKLNATGAAAVGMKASKFRSLPLPFPSFAEQQRIVAKLDALSAETKKLETIYQQKLDDLDELKKSALEKAFSGDL